jgi:dipeptidyl aminopeptidase/acylaminoacyl peptidase
VRMAQRFIELKKANWELAPYPMERHGFVHPESWYDEYRRINELFERTLK